MTQTDIANYLNDWNASTFNGHTDEDVALWISEIRNGLEERDVPRTQWVPVALHFLGDGIRAVLDRVQQMMRELESTESWEWDWDKFTRALIHIHGEHSAIFKVSCGWDAQLYSANRSSQEESFTEWCVWLHLA
jgi:hypothetical protein